MVLRCAVYLISYQTTSQPRAVVWQLYVVTCAIYYSCQGQAFLLSQVGVTTVCNQDARLLSSLPNIQACSGQLLQGPLAANTRVTAVKDAPVANDFLVAVLR